ncbi:MAG: hypothetical protein R3E63_10825 [Pseudomonadales bacterium]
MVDSHAHHAGSAQHDKAAGRPVIVLTRITPDANHFEKLKSVVETWKRFLQPMSGYEGIDIACCTPDQIVWIESWNTKAELDAFNRDHLAFANFISDFFECAKSAPRRDVYRKLL